MASDAWVVVPCYNEALRLDASAFLAAAAGSRAPTFIFVDDGSTDGTRRSLDALAVGIGRLRAGGCRVLALEQNVGKAEAVRAGLRTALDAGASRVGYWDADLATPLDMIEAFDQLLDERRGVDVVMGARVRMLGREIQRSGLRHLAGRAYGTLASLALGVPVYDTQCGAKLLRKSSALEHALQRPFKSRWAFDIELLRRLQEGWGDSGIDRIVEVPLPAWRDVGESKVSMLAGARAFLFLLRLWVQRPGRRLVAGPTGRPASKGTEPMTAGREP